MTPASLDRLRSAIRDVPDFPEPGILFKDITPVLAHPELIKLAVDGMEAALDGQKVDKVVGIDARGFIFGALLAARLGAGFVPARKKGKLPWRTLGIDYALEYGTNSIELHQDAIAPGERVVLALMRQLQADIVASVFFIELASLRGREKLAGFGPIHAVLTY